MSPQIENEKLFAAFVAEMTERTEEGECIRLELCLTWGFNLLSAIQLVLRGPRLPVLIFSILSSIAGSLEEKLGTTPACKEVCRRGWLKEYDRGIDPDLPVTHGQPN